ncbi:MAG: hypothetical protein RLZZ352_1633 [Pseudomonadota bacterium]
MAVYSMTGYATAQTGAATAQPGGETLRETRPALGIEIRSVNSRFLDLSFKLPEELRASEPAIRELLSARLKRGKVELRAWVEGRNESGLRAPSAAELQKLLSMQDSIRAWLPTAAPLSVADVLQLSTRSHGNNSNTNEPHENLLPLVQTALEGLMEARAREGQRLADSLLTRLQALRQLAQDAQPMIPLLVAQQRQRFLDRWAEALNGASPAGASQESARSTLSSEAAEDRALSEATAFALRIDVAEELTRLDAHLSEIERLLGQGQHIGKRLDFLIQELHREANTLGSKSSHLDLTRISVDMKVLIEQMREQVQNIE